MSNSLLVHSIPGRCRFQIDQLADDAEFAQVLQHQIESWELAVSVRINRAARSLVITYPEIAATVEAVQRYVDTCIKQVNHGFDLPENILPADISPIVETADLIPLVNQWQDLRFPVLSLGLALLAAPLELPVFLVSGAIAAAAAPWFRRATDGLIQQQPTIDVLDSLWMGLHTLQGNYLAPALKTCLVESRRTLRSSEPGYEPLPTALLADPKSPQARLIAHFLQTTPVHDTQLGSAQAEFLRTAMVPTLVAGGAIFAATGNLSAAIAPFQLDFGSGIPISISTTLLSALVLAVEQGIYIRSGQVLEKLAQVDTVVLDVGVLKSIDGTCATCAAFQEERFDLYLMHNPLFKPAVTTQIANQLNIPTHQILWPTEVDPSAMLISQLQATGRRVALLGNPLYQETAFACADVSIALAEPGWTMEQVLNHSGDVVLLNQNWQGCLTSFEIAQRAFERVYQNAAIILVPNLIVTGSAICFGFNPLVNVIVNNSSAFVAEFVNGQRPLPLSQTPPEQPTFMQYNWDRWTTAVVQPD